MRITLVRHGQAVSKKTWEGRDEDRPLLARGRRQAEALPRIIGGRSALRLISSPALRCRQTIEPYAQQHRLPVEVSSALSRDSGEAALALIEDLIEEGSGPVVICTHREVLLDVLPRLSKESRRSLDHRLPGAKGAAWVLEFRAGTLQSADYRRPTT